MTDDRCSGRGHRDRSDRHGRRAIAFASDDRARVPFAVIGVLLLVSSSVVVGVLESRPDPRPDVDPSLAMDRTEAAAQTAVREAVLAATERAAERPVTRPNESNAYGRLLVDGPGGDVLENYLRMLIYLELEERLPRAGQEVRDVVTTLSVPPAEDNATLEEGMERVDLVGVDDGVLTVAIRGVSVAVERDGDRIAVRTSTIEVSVATPLFQLHERVETYEERLNAGLDESGFGQRFNARTYAIGWARGWAQYGGLPVTEVIANRHVVPAANSAVFATQEAVFGDAVDPAASNAMTRGWLCMAAQDAEELYGGYRDSNADAIADVNGEDLCDALELVYGDRVGEADVDEPSVQDLLGRAPGMDETETIGVNETALLPLARLLGGDGEHSIDSVVDRIFTVEVATDTDVDVEDWVEPDPGPPDDSGNWTRIDDTGVRHLGTSVREVSFRERRAGFAGTYASFDAEVRNAHEREVTWRNESAPGHSVETTRDVRGVNLSLSASITEGGHSPDANVDAANPDAGIDLKYRVGDGGSGVHSINYVRAPEEAIEAVIGNDPEADFETIVERAVAVDHPLDAEAALDAEVDDVTLDDELRPDDLDLLEELPTPLYVAVADDLQSVQDDVADVTVEFERSELIHEGDEDGPFDELLAAVAAKENEWVEEDDYDSVGEKTIYEARRSYFELLKADLRRVADAHETTMEGLDEQLEDANAGVADAAAFLRQGTTRDDPGPGTLEAPELVSDVTYEVSGSPTYLVADPVTRADVPAVENGDDYAPMAVHNENFFSIPYESLVSGILSRIPLLGLDDPDAEITFRVAGEALRAARLAESVSGDSIGGTDELEDDVRWEIRMVSRAVAEHTTAELDLSASRAPGISESLVTRDVREEIEDVLDEEWDSPAHRATALGSGDATEPVVERIVAVLGDPEYRPDEYDDRPELWAPVVRATATTAVADVVADATVSVDDVEDVEELDAQVRDELRNVTADVIEERLGDAEFALDDENYDEWIDGTDTPNRVPAGLPLTPVPGYWFATMNVWDVTVGGEYARFAVTANTGTPAVSGGTTYVRENATVTVDVDGRERKLGATEPISFEGRSIVVVVVPPGGTGVGDRTGTRSECSETWPQYGPIAEEDDDTTDGAGNGRRGPLFTRTNGADADCHPEA